MYKNSSHRPSKYFMWAEESWAKAQLCLSPLPLSSCSFSSSSSPCSSNPFFFSYSSFLCLYASSSSVLLLPLLILLPPIVSLCVIQRRRPFLLPCSLCFICPLSSFSSCLLSSAYSPHAPSLFLYLIVMLLRLLLPFPPLLHRFIHASYSILLILFCWCCFASSCFFCFFLLDLFLFLPFLLLLVLQPFPLLIRCGSDQMGTIVRDWFCWQTICLLY